MGTWGFGIFEDDSAADVRDDFKDLLTSGLDGDAATGELLKRWKHAVDDPDEAPVFWLALALTQHRLGRLGDRVKREALRAIENDAGLERWREAGDRELARRRAALAQARTLLESPQPQPKKITPAFRDTCAWEAGELIAYRLASGRQVVFRVVDHETHAYGVSPVFELLDWQGERPTRDDLMGSRVAAGAMPCDVLLRALAAAGPEHARHPHGAMQAVLSQMGLLRKPEPGPLGFDGGLMQAMTEVIERLKAGDATVTEKVRRFAKRRSPKLVQPLTQFSVRREFRKAELPARRVQRLRITLPASPSGDWIVFRWHELDAGLLDVFGVG